MRSTVTGTLLSNQRNPPWKHDNSLFTHEFTSMEWLKCGIWVISNSTNYCKTMAHCADTLVTGTPSPCCCFSKGSVMHFGYTRMSNHWCTCLSGWYMTCNFVNHQPYSCFQIHSFYHWWVDLLLYQVRWYQHPASYQAHLWLIPCTASLMDKNFYLLALHITLVIFSILPILLKSISSQQI